jgi:hypothetical protein
LYRTICTDSAVTTSPRENTSTGPITVCAIEFDCIVLVEYQSTATIPPACMPMRQRRRKSASTRALSSCRSAREKSLAAATS